MSDSDLDRFVQAQDDGGVLERALVELAAGCKTSHWMWFVLPQIAGLGGSPMAQRYSIRSLDEARAYLTHPVLGPRLRRTTRTVLEAPAPTAEALLGPVDAQKLRSSMTLFARADPDDDVFRAVLDRYFDGAADAATDERL